MTSNNITQNTSTENQENYQMSTSINTTAIADADAVVEAAKAKPKEYTFEDMRAMLAAAGGTSPTRGRAVARHKTPANKISLPEGMPVATGAKTLAEVAQAEQEREDFVQSFNYRPWDGALALTRVMENTFGTTGRSVPTRTMFGDIPPKQITIEVAYGKTARVPWGEIEFAPLEGKMELGTAYDEDYGSLFQISINAPKKHADAIQGFFKLIEMELAENSIYKGAAIRGTDNPKFIPTEVDPNIVYNDEVYGALDTTIWGVLRHPDLLRADKQRIDPKVLLHGPYGTGKSEAGRMTAQKAIEAGWTFISYNSGEGKQDDLKKTVQTARLLAPAVVFVEDVDIYARDKDAHAQSRLLEMFDGISSKGQEVIIIMTTNKAEDLSKGMLRAGRINAMIEIGPLNEKATIKLIQRLNEGKLAEDIDYEAIFKATEGYTPSFIRQTLDDAAKASLIRTADELLAKTGKVPSYQEVLAKVTLSTHDFVSAAHVLRPQYDKYEASSDQHTPDSLGDVIQELLTDVMERRLAFSNDNMGSIDVERVDASELSK
jgi:transitional endoplasmic reticulum ATPase